MERKAGRFAAPAEIHGAIVDLLPAAVRDRIVEHVKSDLVKSGIGETRFAVSFVAANVKPGCIRTFLFLHREGAH